MVDLASITSGITEWIARNGVYAVFVLMAIDALLPAGGELIMLYAGVLASGALAGHSASLLGIGLATGLPSYLVLAASGTLGYLAGALVGWAIGRWGGRALVERHGRRLHLAPATFARAERWFERHGAAAVLLGRVAPVVRSFISIPAGVFETRLPIYVPLTLLGSAIWCFAFAAAGWALGGSWESFHQSFRYADYAIAAVTLVLVAAFALRRLRSRRSGPSSRSSTAEDPAD